MSQNSRNLRPAIPFPQSRRFDVPMPARERVGTRPAVLQTPESLEAEQSTLGAALIDRAAIAAIASIVAPDDFYRELHRKIWTVVLDLDARTHVAEFDFVLVGEELRSRGLLGECGGSEYLVALIEACPSSANASAYARVVLEKATARRALEIGETLKSGVAGGQNVPGAPLEWSTQSVLSNAISQLQSASNRLQNAGKRIQKYSDDTALDALVSDVSWLWPGWIPRGSLTLVAGRPDAGKSSVVMDICRRVIDGGTWPDEEAIEPLDPFDDSPTQILWIDTESSLGIFRQRLHGWGFPRGHFVFAQGNELKPMLIDSDDDWAWINQAVRDKNPPLVVVDSLSHAHQGDENSNDYMKFVMRRLADLAAEHNIAVIAIHHLNKLPAGLPDWPITQDMIRGASTIGALPRSVIGVGRPVKDDPSAFGFMSVKLNIAAKPDAIGYVTTAHCPAWGEVPQSAERQKPAELAGAFLMEYLANGPRLSTEAKAECAARGVCSRSTLENEIKNLCRSYKEGGTAGRWFIELRRANSPTS